MVMARLLTYRQDIPQEGRLETMIDDQLLHVRVSIMPTTHGLRAVVRMPAELIQPKRLDDLQLPSNVVEKLKNFAQSDSGLLLLTGPAGSGKTTTIYALLEHIVASNSGVSIICLEDPVERDLPGITQIQVQPFGQLTYERALRSVLRQDPQLLMLGEIRDTATATLAIQAALSGHRLISTMHASTPAGAIARLLEMGIEPYQITSALYGVVSQRLLRRKTSDGYTGRIPVAEGALLTAALRKRITECADAANLGEAIRSDPDFVPIRRAAEELVGQQITDEAELQRVLGVTP
jgi:type II secretory ATPase GspE/PulE/Tfp pilus assembly ATPase PilB-like protein